jgi:hypothetical protein
MARLDIAVWRLYGTFTMYFSRTTRGEASVNRSERISVPSFSMSSAFSESTKHVARRTETILSGSKVALRTSALFISTTAAFFVS